MEPVTAPPTDQLTTRSHRRAIAARSPCRTALHLATLRLPQLKALRLSELELAALMLLLVVLAGVGSVAAELLARRRDSALALRVALGLVAVGVVVIGQAARGDGSLPLLVAGMAVYGLGLGANDASANMQAVAVEHHLGRPVMPSFHAAWTAGGLVATLGAITLPDVSIPAGSLALAVLPLAILASPFVRRDHGAPTAVPDPDAVGVRWRIVWLVGLGLVVFYAVDTAVTAWGPIYLSSDDVFTAPPTSPSMYALATLPYLVAVLLALVVGDAATARFGEPTVVRGGLTASSARRRRSRRRRRPVRSGLSSASGRRIAPLAFSAAARVAGEGADPALHRARVDAVVARFNQFNYAGALIGSVLTGALGSTSLRVGFAVPMVLVLALVPLARHFASVGSLD
jgi:hypothetical protein